MVASISFTRELILTSSDQQQLVAAGRQPISFTAVSELASDNEGHDAEAADKRRQFPYRPRGLLEWQGANGPADPGQGGNGDSNPSSLPAPANRQLPYLRKLARTSAQSVRDNPISAPLLLVSDAG